jgi:3-oxoacyl-[acyl-carrier protein] reductase
VNYRSNEEAAHETVRQIEEAGGSAELLQFDVTDPDAVDSAIKDAAKRHGRLDILVNNAGISIDQLLLRVSASDMEATWKTNVNGALFCAKACIRPMMRAKWGRIISLSSVVGESGNAGQVVYSSSKAALLGMTRSLAREYASRGITVNAVAPGFIETDMTAELPEAARRGIIDQTPLGRIGRPEEVAAAVVFLASEEASYITGQVVRVNGGMHV